MKARWIFIILTVSVLALAGCKKAETTPAANAANANPSANEPPGMDEMEMLILGTFKLEGTENAVTSTQAAELLPLWTLIQGGSLKSDAETRAVLKQIKENMTQAQLAAIDAMQLTIEDQRAWMEEQGITFHQGGAPDDAPGGQGGPGAFQNLSEDERARMRDEFQNLDPEARATRMAELGLQQPGGAPPSGGQGGEGFDPSAMAPGDGGRMGGGNFLIQPLITLLATRAAQ